MGTKKTALTVTLVEVDQQCIVAVDCGYGIEERGEDVGSGIVDERSVCGEIIQYQFNMGFIELCKPLPDKLRRELSVAAQLHRWTLIEFDLQHQLHDLIDLCLIILGDEIVVLDTVPDLHTAREQVSLSVIPSWRFTCSRRSWGFLLKRRIRRND